MITVDTLKAAGIASAQAEVFVDPLSAACARFDIDTPQRLAAFIGQCAVESGCFTALEENLYYTSAQRIQAVWPSRVPNADLAASLVCNPQALANRVYAGRLGNGDEASGDGWRYRGRGLIGITGMINYTLAATALAMPLVTDPDLVAQPEGACLTAAWYWHTHKLNALADAGLVDAITRQVNGPATMHADLRRQYTEKAVSALA